MDEIGQQIDRLDNLVAALNIPISADQHVQQIKNILPEIIKELKTQYVEVFDENPWDYS
ncbi:MAG: hypothetical protein AAF298_00320 [Cyanobacteria bacterium P01_A01_bin.40]